MFSFTFLPNKIKAAMGEADAEPGFKPPNELRSPPERPLTVVWATGPAAVGGSSAGFDTFTCLLSG